MGTANQAALTIPSPSETGHGSSGLIGGLYEVVRPLALGGMGCLLAARHQVTGRLVAVKMVRPELRDREDMLRRLRDEAIALGRVSHPHALGVVDAGECSFHGPYVATELLEGRPLDGLLAARTSLDVAQVVRMMTSVARALRAVHRARLVHRDVKPSNVFVSLTEDGSETIKLIDFGVVSFGERSRDIGLTRAGEVLGTLCYMSPEQVLHPEAVDGRADLYALGVTALECLGARRATNLVVRLRTPRPSRMLLAGRDDVPEALIDLLDDLLEADSAARVPSAAALLERLIPIAAAVGPSRPLMTYANASQPAEGVPADGVPTVVEPAIRRARNVVAVKIAERVLTERRDARAPFTTPIRITQGHRVVDGRCEDISVRGALVTVNAALAVGEPAVLRIALPTTGRVADIKVNPRWVREHGNTNAIGLELDAIDSASRQAIARHVFKLVG